MILVIFSPGMHFIDKFNKEMNKDIRTIRPSVIGIFQEYDWPGNIRELENVIQYMMVLSPSEELRDILRA